MKPNHVADERFMRAGDAFSWYMEQDPVLRSTIVAVAWLAGSPDWHTIVTKLEHGTRMVPMFRQRVMDLPGRMTPPRWTDVTDFDISWHLSRVDAPEPRDETVVMDIARRDAMTGFDRAHPLWQFTLVDHLEGGRAALVMKVHHSLTDGLGGMQLALMLFDPDREPAPPPDAPLPPVEVAPGGSQLLAQRLGWRATRSAGFLARRARAAVPDVWATIRNPLRAGTDVVGEVASIARTVAPVRQTMSPLMTGRSLRRQLQSLSVPLTDLRSAGARAGVSVNDAFLAAVTGGMRLYHEHHGVLVEHLRVTMPISIRTPDDPVGGNRITLMRFPLPVAETNPARRMADIRSRTRKARHEPSLPLTDAIAAALNMLPSAVVGSILRNVDFVASDVPGFPHPVFLAGAPVERYEAYGPTTGTAANLTMLSYNGRCYIGVTTDTAAVPDPDVFMRCLRLGFAEVLGNTPAAAPVVTVGSKHDGVVTDEDGGGVTG